MHKAIETARRKLTLLQYGDKSNETGGNFQAASIKRFYQPNKLQVVENIATFGRFRTSVLPKMEAKPWPKTGRARRQKAALYAISGIRNRAGFLAACATSSAAR